MFDLSSALILLLIVLIITVPVIIFKIMNGYLKSGLQKEFETLRQKKNLELYQKEMWKNRYMIGLSDIKKKVIYLRKNGTDYENKMIDLARIEKCRIAIYDKVSGNTPSHKKNSDSLELVFTLRGNGAGDEVLEFYKSTEFMPSPDDYNLVKKRSELINERI